MLLAGASNALSPFSDLSVGATAAGTLDVTAGVQTVKSLTVGSAGTMNLSIGKPLASLNNVTFNGGSTLDIFGTINSTPQLLMTYGGSYFGTFTNVFDNGSPISPSELTYSGGSIEVSTAVSSFSGSGMWIGRNGSWNTNTNWTDGVNNGVPGNGLQGLGHDTASFNGSGVPAITLDINPNVAALSFSGGNYSLSGGTLTLQQGVRARPPWPSATARRRLPAPWRSREEA